LKKFLKGKGEKMSKFIPERISKIDQYIPGKPAEEIEREYGIKESIKLASNENPLGPSPKVVDAICKAAKNVNLYPIGDAYYLRQKLSEKYNMPMERIICGSGSVDILEMIPRAFLEADENIVTSELTFVSYKIATYMVNTNYREAPQKNYGYDLDAILDLIDEKTKIVYIANPNNPTGTMIRKVEFEKFIDKLPPHPILVMDEAYFEFIDDPDYPDGMDYLDSRDRIVILRTFSKIHGLAGLRVGYGFSSEEIINVLNKVRSPFNVNVIAQAAAIASLDDSNQIERSRESNKKGLKYLSKEFDRIGLKYVPSYANFILTFPDKPASEVDEALKRRGIIARPGGAKALRITIGTEEQNQILIKALEEIL
jgi:histidinol-phosphate aminotransferase